MTNRSTICRAIATMLLGGMLAITAPSLMADDGVLSVHVDKEGRIHFPKDFRINMVHIGSWYVPDGGASGFHDVYTEKSSVEAFRKTGQFPDGATIVKELRASATGDYTTGKGVAHSTAGLKQWFVMIKDKQGRFEQREQWGDGWGWALFTPDAPTRNAVVNYKRDCLGCHIPAKHNDWIYTEAYPVLSP